MKYTSLLFSVLGVGGVCVAGFGIGNLSKGNNKLDDNFEVYDEDNKEHRSEYEQKCIEGGNSIVEEGFSDSHGCKKVIPGVIK